MKLLTLVSSFILSLYISQTHLTPPLTRARTADEAAHTGIKFYTQSVYISDSSSPAPDPGQDG